MKMKVITIYLLFITFISCTQKSTDYENLILGDWKIYYEPPKITSDSTIILLPPRERNLFGKPGFSFFKNGEMENKLGYFDLNKKHENGRTKRIFLGTFTKFKINDTCLKTFDLADQKWINTKIFKLTKDTLILEYNDKSKETFVKQNYIIDSQNSFDKIIVSTSGC